MAKMFKDPGEYALDRAQEGQAVAAAHQLEAHTKQLEAEVRKMEILEPYLTREMEAAIAAKNARTRFENSAANQIDKTLPLELEKTKIENKTKMEEYNQLMRDRGKRDAMSTLEKINAQANIDMYMRDPKEYTRLLQAAERYNLAQVDAINYNLMTRQRYASVSKVRDMMAQGGSAMLEQNRDEVNATWMQHFGRPLAQEGEVISDVHAVQVQRVLQSVATDLELAQKLIEIDRQGEWATQEAGIRREYDMNKASTEKELNLKKQIEGEEDIRRAEIMQSILNHPDNRDLKLGSDGYPMKPNELGQSTKQFVSQVNRLVARARYSAMNLYDTPVTNNELAVMLTSNFTYDDQSIAGVLLERVPIPNSMFNGQGMVSREQIIDKIEEYVEAQDTIWQRARGVPLTEDQRREFVQDRLMRLWDTHMIDVLETNLGMDFVSIREAEAGR